MGRSFFLGIVNKSRKGRLIWAGLLGILLLAGCGGNGEPGKGAGPAGPREKATLNSNRAISEKELGILFYPGAAVGESLTTSRDTDEKPGAMKQALLTTPDTVAKVKAFYLKAYPKARSMDMNSPEAAMAQLIVQDTNEQKYIMITRKAKEDRTSVMMRYITEK